MTIKAIKFQRMPIEDLILDTNKSENSQDDRVWASIMKLNKSNTDGSNGAPAAVAKFNPGVITMPELMALRMPGRIDAGIVATF
jgi:hypothetical protein